MPPDLAASFERGDPSQPYRYVAMFDPDQVQPFVPTGATVDLVNRTRLPIKPLEQLPTERNRYAIGARYNKRLNIKKQMKRRPRRRIARRCCGRCVWLRSDVTKRS